MTNQEGVPQQQEKSGEVIRADFARNRFEHDPLAQQEEGLNREIEALKEKEQRLVADIDQIRQFLLHLEDKRVEIRAVRERRREGSESTKAEILHPFSDTDKKAS